MYEAEIKRGSQWLDKFAPGWDEKVDIRTLDLELYGHCALGQTFGQLCSENLCADYDFALAHGFYIPNAAYKKGEKIRRRNFQRLSGAWIHEVLRRRAAKRLQQEVLTKVTKHKAVKL